MRKSTKTATEPKKPAGSAFVKPTTENMKDMFAMNLMGNGTDQFAKRRTQPLCVRCGHILNDSTALRANKSIYPTGYNPLCVTCQQKKYADIAATTSRTYALFYCCIAFDIPYDPDIVAEIQANQNGTWFEYLRLFQRPLAGLDEKDGEVTIRTWQDGITDIADAFSGEFPVLPITGDLMVSNMDELPREERWKIEWGDGWEESEYREMDNRYMMLTSEWKGTPIPPRTSMSLHDVVRNMLLRDKDMKTDASSAKKRQDIINSIMSSEDLKVKVNREQETLKVDKLVQRLEEMGAIKNGDLVSYEELVEILRNDRRSYDTSLDVVDSMMMCIINTMRKNMGMSELDSLPKEAQVRDKKGELLSEMSEEEKGLMKGLEMKPPMRE